MKLRVLLLLLLLVACEEIPEDEGVDEVIHKISLELEQISEEPLYPASILSYNYTLLNIGREDYFDVALETKMRKQSTGEIIKTQGEIVPMALVVFKEKGIDIPRDIEKGEYELSVVATWDGGQDVASFKFSVDREDEPEEENTDSEEDSSSDEPVQQEDKGIKLVLEEDKAEDKEDEKDEEKSEGSDITVNVVIQDYQYDPQILNITVGTTVVWYNNDSVPHSASGAGFDSGPISKGDTFSHKFTKAVTKIYSSTFTEGPYGTIHISE